MSAVLPPTVPAEEMPAARVELADRALAFYETALKAALEPEHDGKGLAIHPDSGDYSLAPTPTHASRALWQRHPEGGIVTMRVGPTPDFALSARILAGRMAAQFEEIRGAVDGPEVAGHQA